LATLESGEEITRDREKIISKLLHAIVKIRGLTVFGIALAVFMGGLSGKTWASPNPVGLSELQRLVAKHQPQRAPGDVKSLDVLSREVDLGSVAGKVRFSIPGFKAFGCDECHQGRQLLDSAAVRMQAVLTRLKHLQPEISTVPLEQFIIQPWADALLAPRQFAHTTFDTIRIFPRTILIDSRVYDNATQLHETLHLTQGFVGAANELEAYGLNIRSDPRFLLLNYPYFSDVVTAFFLADFQRILKGFYARPVKDNLHVPREVQWFMNPLDAMDLKSLTQAVNGMAPVLNDVTELLKKYPVRASYWSEQTGNAAFLLEVAAVRLSPLPSAPEIPEKVRLQAFAIIDKQMRKTDNTRLGYVIDRKKEALLTLKYQLKMNDPLQRLSLYFHYLKGRFIGPSGEVRLGVENRDDLIAFAEKKLQGIRKMAQSDQLTLTEKNGANHMIESIKEKLKDF
jgi:hypothetical protein